MQTHQKKKSLFGNLENYLDKELLGKDAPKKEEPLHLNTKGRNSASNSNSNYDQKYWVRKLWTKQLQIQTAACPPEVNLTDTIELSQGDIFTLV